MAQVFFARLSSTLRILRFKEAAKAVLQGAALGDEVSTDLAFIRNSTADFSWEALFLTSPAITPRLLFGGISIYYLCKKMARFERTQLSPSRNLKVLPSNWR